MTRRTVFLAGTWPLRRSWRTIPGILSPVTIANERLGACHYEGTIGSDGRVMLTHTGVGAGTMAGGAGMGEPISVRFAGAFQGERFTATALDTRRDCRIELTRHR